MTTPSTADECYTAPSHDGLLEICTDDGIWCRSQQFDVVVTLDHTAQRFCHDILRIIDEFLGLHWSLSLPLVLLDAKTKPENTKHSVIKSNQKATPHFHSLTSIHTHII